MTNSISFGAIKAGLDPDIWGDFHAFGRELSAVKAGIEEELRQVSIDTSIHALCWDWMGRRVEGNAPCWSEVIEGLVNCFEDVPTLVLVRCESMWLSGPGARVHVHRYLYSVLPEVDRSLLRLAFMLVNDDARLYSDTIDSLHTEVKDGIAFSWLLSSYRCCRGHLEDAGWQDDSLDSSLDA